MFDRVGRVDPVTKGLEIAVHWVGLSIDFNFWSQHVSFLLVGCIVVTSIRGLLLTLTKVCLLLFFQDCSSNIYFGLVFLRNFFKQVFKCHRATFSSNNGLKVVLFLYYHNIY